MTKMFRALRATYGKHTRSFERISSNKIRNFVTDFSLLDNARPNRPHPDKEGIAAVADSLRGGHEELIRRRNQYLGLPYATT